MNSIYRSFLCALGVVLVAGCSYENPNAPPDVTSRGDTRQMQLATAAGLDVPNAVAARTDAELGQASNAALTAATLINPIPGVTSAGALGMGFIGFLTAPPAGAEASDQMIATLPVGADPAPLARDIQDAAYAIARADLTAKGYELLDEPTMPGMRTFVKPGCPTRSNGSFDPKCTQAYTPVLTERGQASGQQVYMVTIYTSGDMRKLVPAPYYENYDPRLTRRIVDSKPRNLHLYFAPRKLDGAWTRAALYTGGQLLPL